MATMMILFAIFVFEIASSNQIIKFGNASESIYDSTVVESFKNRIDIANENINQCTEFSEVICYNHNDTVEFDGNPIKILIFGGFYTHPYAPILLLRFAENFARDNFDELKDMIEIHILPLVNKGGFNKMIENKNTDEVKTNYEDGKGCNMGINIDRNFESHFPENSESCNGDITESRGSYAYEAKESEYLRKLWRAHNYTFIFNYQGHKKGLIIPYAYSDKSLSKEDAYIYEKLLGTTAKSYNDYYNIDAGGTFIDTAYDYGMYPVYVGIGDPDNFERTMDLDYKYKELKGYILNGIGKPVVSFMGINEQSNCSEIVIIYQFLNLLPSSCEATFNIKFFFGLNDNFEYKMCKLVTQHEFDNKPSTTNCEATSSETDDEESFAGYDYKIIYVEYMKTMMKYTNYTIKLYFTRDEEKNKTVHIETAIKSEVGGIRFETITHNETYDITPYVELPTTAPQWAIGVIMLGIFILIVFAIVSCVMIRKKPGSLL